MSHLLDTHIFIALVEGRFDELPFAVRQEVEASGHVLYLSVASLWEIAIKWRIGKLPLKSALEGLPDAANRAGITLLLINERHALAHVEPEPPTRDPFDRLLLAQCAVEDMKLVTIDAALAGHPLSSTAG
ncbi:type II toxin-antitoxin system VapC family toxin [Pararhizobium sp. LjRoot235]|uniref:type II toxin-antitoxin system VapC family toxin n=1 Tax=Pararhizobium sp. LjRoot235 TaxID=3342291 RepID=UPI003ED028A1